jgi:hypothetical protein
MTAEKARRRPARESGDPLRASLRLAIGLAITIGTGLAPAAASAATHASATPTPAAAPPAAPGGTTAAPTGGGDPDTTVTFSVNVGGLTMTAPTSANLGSGNPGGTISGNLNGNVVVTDVRATLGGTWVATASSTAWTTGTGTPDETIPAGDATYAPGTIAVTGTSNAATGGHIITLSGSPQNVVTATVTGNNTATWDPTITVAVPDAAVGGAYTATLTQSVA